MRNKVHSANPRRWIALSIALVSLYGCETSEEKREKAIAAVGVDASITAAMFVSAVRTCQVVGFNDVTKCADHKGSLLAEQSAQITANVSVEKTASYWKTCLASFTNDYCNQLIQRAVAIEYRQPPAPR